MLPAPLSRKLQLQLQRPELLLRVGGRYSLRRSILFGVDAARVPLCVHRSGSNSSTVVRGPMFVHRSLLHVCVVESVPLCVPHVVGVCATVVRVPMCVHLSLVCSCPSSVASSCSSAAEANLCQGPPLHCPLWTWRASRAVVSAPYSSSSSVADVAAAVAAAWAAASSSP